MVAPGYRVVQWATGNIGMRSLRAVIDHPTLTLVGLHVHDPAKEGRDAGELCGLPPIGVPATRQIDAVIAAGPDCVLYMPQACDFAEIERLLSSGINVVTTRGEFHRPAGMDPARRQTVEAACRAGRASIHSTGSSPGFISEALPLVLASLERRLDFVGIDEFADLSSRNSPELLFGIMGFGADPGRFDARRAEHLRYAHGPSLELLAEAMSLPLDGLEAGGEVAVATRTVEIAAGAVAAGTVAAQRMHVTGLRGGEPLVRFRANWYCTTDIDPAWSLRETGWRLEVKGDAPLDVDIRFPVAPEDYAAISPGYTAHRAVNAVPYVCAAAPGIRTSVELPQLVPAFG